VHRRGATLPFAFALLGVAGCSKVATHDQGARIDSPRQSPWIRVALAEDVEKVTLELQGPAQLRCCAGHTRAWESGRRVEITLRDGVIALDDGDAAAGSRRPLRVESLHPSTQIRFGEHAYRGTFEIRAGERGLTVVNEIELEVYLRGVVPWEIGWQDPQRRTAVEAQAIAARTYACKRLGQYADLGFDVYADVSDQVYQGTTREDSIANAAIENTRGEVLLDGERLVEAYYCSTCGGHTARIESVWPKPAEAYLKGRRDRASEGGSAFCATSNHFRWQEAWSGAELEELLQQTLPPELDVRPVAPLGGLVDLAIDSHDETGRAHELVVEMTSGVYRVAGDRVRWVLRPRDRSILRSTMFKLDVQRDASGAIVRVIARGGGNGHGVGMCQVGALEMSRRGYDAPSILAHYYPGTRLRTLYRR
jgi:stage II sporulation protein D